MQIKDMFRRDINRYINGVVSVGDDAGVAQELEEYVVTNELQRHFDDFFTAFEQGIDSPERNTGVWIQGYFGSGKSHFLKMLSYLLENREVNGRHAVDYFADKFADEMTYSNIRRVAEASMNETILFNIDEKGAGYKEGDTAETAVLHAVARVFYEHLGFYGEDYKLARFEKMIDDRGKTTEFREAYRDITGEDWLDSREAYDMYGDEVAEAAHRALGVSPGSIREWADSTDNVRIQPGDLVDDIDEYARRREQECGGTFRLVFMIDEMGQYLNGDVNRMLNLQTLMEQFGDKCGGRVWMVVTSQEAIDDMANVVSMDFSKIQGRFDTRLSLSSSSVDEVIKRRVLDKTDPAREVLDGEYQQDAEVLKNLFSFGDSRGDLRGYADAHDFADSYPFVGYQFTLMPSILKEIRKHGYQGKSLSTGERSMLSCYQEATQAVEQDDERALVPLWRFFDTLERELDHGDKQVFERCRKAAEEDRGLKPFDVDVLKALYLVTYLTDIKRTAANIAILMVDSIDVDIVSLRDRVTKALGRLVGQNYAARSGETYNYLTDEEQDVAREIRGEQVDTSAITEEVQQIVYSSIFRDTKYHRGANDFPIDRYVDDQPYGVTSRSAQGMRLNIVTLADTQLADAPDSELDLRSADQALVVLDSANDYYDVLYNAARVQSYVRRNNVQSLSPSKRRIIEDRQREAANSRAVAVGLISEAILHARVSVNGHAVTTPATTAQQKILGALDELVGYAFPKAELVDAPVADDAQLRQVLSDTVQQGLAGAGEDQGAAEEVERWLSARTRTHQPTTMGDVQRQFQGRPYGWREIDVAAVVARLWVAQRVTLTRAGARLQPSDAKACDALRKRTEVDKISIEERRAMPVAVVNTAKALLRELDSSAQVPDDEDGLVAAVAACLQHRKEHCADVLRQHYGPDSRHPGRDVLEQAAHLASEVLDQRNDPEQFLRAFVEAQDDLLDNAEDLEDVESFFSGSGRQAEFFDQAVDTVDLLRRERVYVEGDQDVQDALRQMEQILDDPHPYPHIKDLPQLQSRATASYRKLVASKQREMLDQLEGAGDQVEAYAEQAGQAAATVAAEAKRSVVAWRERIHAARTCSELDAIGAQVDAWQAAQLERVDNAVAQCPAPEARTEASSQAATSPAPRAPRTKALHYSDVLPGGRILHDEAEVDAYLAQARQRLLDALHDADVSGVRLGR